MKRSLIFAISLLFFLGCGMTKTPITHRTQLMMISPAEEIAMGEKSYREILAKSKLSTNKKEVERIRRIGRRLAKASGKNYNWEFNLIDEDKVNAFCLPGGKVVVYRGILKVAKNDDQLATVMSHEIGHALARHGAERMSMQMATQTVQKLGNMVLGATIGTANSKLINMAYNIGTQYGVLLPYSRKHEDEADEIGIILMNKAGYNIYEALKFWENMKALKNGQEVPALLSTHPSDESRIEHIKKVIERLKREGKLAK